MAAKYRAIGWSVCQRLPVDKCPTRDEYLKKRAQRPAPTDESKAANKGQSKDFASNTYLDYEYEYITNLHDPYDVDSHVVPVTIYFNGRKRELRALIDNGAVDGNYINTDIARWLRECGQVPLPCHTFVKSPLINSKGVDTKENFLLHFTYLNEITHEQDYGQLQAKVLNMDYDLIVGRPSIKEYDLSRTLPSQFRKMLSQTLDEKERTRLSGVACESVPDGESPAPESTASFRQEEDGVWRNRPESAVTPDEERSRLESALDDLDNGNPQEDALSLIQFYGSELLQKRLREMCTKYKHIFRTSLTAQPAKIPPMELHVDEKKWREAKDNKRPPRQQSTLKRTATAEQIRKYLDISVIKTSQQASHSQVLMTPKPDGTYRFCVDFSPLNAVTHNDHNWPIPNIWDMLQRLGKRRSKFFGILDLTAGYYQAPMHENSQWLTAFVAFSGIYEWARVPMRLKGAPSYFQAMIASVVLAGLMYVVCEAYIDDIIVTGQTEDEFCNNLEQVLQRFERYNITVHPKKVRLGMESAEFVGHTISEEGLSFSRPKLDSILNFPLPSTVKELRSFLGLANYFRNHVNNHSTLAKPLHDLVKHSPTNLLKWSSDEILAFEKLKTAVHECPQLSFRKPGTPLHLYTDASDYGIGAYVCQEIDGIEQPLAFLSRLLVDEQKNWSTLDKEGFAIFYAFKELEYLLRDECFTVHTDHANLRHIHEGSSGKVRRWWQTMQEYRFDLKHIAGSKNAVADAFSRLCTIREFTDDTLVAADDAISSDIAKVFSRLCAQREEEKDDETSPSKSFEEAAEAAVKVLKAKQIQENIFVPDKYFNKIKQVHNSELGHFGIDMTVRKLREVFGEPWEGQRAHVTSFIRRCPCCQKMSQLKTPIHTSRFTTATSHPMERLNIDTLGPFKPDSKGNTYIIVVIDAFSRWIELYPVPDLTAEVATEALLQHFGRYGTATFVTDNGTQFVNQLVQELVLLLNTTHFRTTAYSKEENAIVERSNKEILRHLRAMIFDENSVDHWHRYLPQIQRIMNSSVHSRLGVSPAQIIFGGALNLNRNMFASKNEVKAMLDENRKSLSTWASDMLTAQSRFIKLAQDTQERFDIEHMRKDPPASQKKTFPLNSLVLAMYPASNLKKGPPHKHLTFKKGPMRVQGKDIYHVMNLCTNKVESIHGERLSPYLHDTRNMDPVQVAYRDNELFNIEKVVSFANKTKAKKHWSFLVKWEGYDDSYNTWEPWKVVQANSVVHDFLRSINMGKVIPSSYKLDTDD